MTITPSEIFSLALKRHRAPWNWTLHFAALFGFGLTLLLHSYLVFAVTMIVFGTGFFELGLPKAPDNRWFGFVTRGVEWEKNWVAAPWGWYKIRRFIYVLLIGLLTIWALWTRDAAVLALLIGFAFLIRIMRENMDVGIDP